MAIVPNLAEPGGPIDLKYSSYSRESAGTPNASLTPAFTGEIVLDTTNAVLWQAKDLTNDSWVMLSSQYVAPA